MKKRREHAVTGEDLVTAFADLFELVPPETSEEVDAELCEIRPAGTRHHRTGSEAVHGG